MVNNCNILPDKLVEMIWYGIIIIVSCLNCVCFRFGFSIKLKFWVRYKDRYSRLGLSN